MRFSEVVSDLKRGFLLLLLLIGLTGLAYPLLVTEFAQLVFPWQANGSLIKDNNTPIGSLLIGQSFTEPKYFWGRPSATQPTPYNGIASAASNLGPSDPKLVARIIAQYAQLKPEPEARRTSMPIDLLTTSGSGLDPEISTAAAFFQVPRISAIRDIPFLTVWKLVTQHSQKRTFHLLGANRVNVLELNLALDHWESDNGRKTTRS